MSDFKINYGKGYVSVNVNTYFAKADLLSIKKLFKLARNFCTEEDREQLLSDLSNAKQFWQETYSDVQISSVYWTGDDMLPSKKKQIPWAVRAICPSTQKQLQQLQAKLDRVIEILKAENWINS